MTAPLRTRFLSIGVLALVFASGALVGIAVDRRVVDETQVATRDGDDVSEQDDDGGDRRMLYEQVDGLRPEQAARIDSVLDHHRQSTRALSREFREAFQSVRDLEKEVRSAYDPRWWAIVDSTRTAIRSIFDPAQAAQYDSLVADYDRRRRDDERSDSAGSSGR